ncbi:MAG: hypothetical protein ACFCU1_12540 [Sumerlaeia bacterium]
MRKQFSTIAVTLLLSCSSLIQAVPIEVIYSDGPNEGFNDPTLGPQRRAAFEYAMSIWSSRLQGNITITVDAAMDPLGGTPSVTTLGFAGPFNIFGNFQAAPVRDTWYVSALANQLANIDIDDALGSNEVEAFAVFNSDVDNQIVLGSTDWYYGLDGNPPGNDISFVRTVLHEFGHAFGFIGILETNQNGIPTGNYDLFPSIYDRYVRRGNTNNAPALTSLSQSSRLAALTSDNLFWFGPAATASSGQRLRLYAPSIWESGSSYSHYREGTNVNGQEELMEPFLDTNKITLTNTDDLFKDLGWNLLGPTQLPTLNIASAPNNATEGIPYQYVFSLSGAQTQPVTANVAFSGTATFNTDYTVSATTLTFPPGSTSQSITVSPIAEQNVVDNNETISIRVNRIIGAEFGNQLSATTIVANALPQTRSTWMLY